MLSAGPRVARLLRSAPVQPRRGSGDSQTGFRLRDAASEVVAVGEFESRDLEPQAEFFGRPFGGGETGVRRRI